MLFPDPDAPNRQVIPDVYKRQVLEKVLPEVQAVGLDNLEEYLRRKLAGHD